MTACDLIEDWGISDELARRLVIMMARFADRTGHELTVISGFRSPEKQSDLDERGRPAAPCELSTHCICPATGADLRISGFPARQLILELGAAAILSGLRWGGGSPIEDGIPSDWPHVDLGPRTDAVAAAFRSRL